MYNINDVCDFVILRAKSDEDIPLNNLKLQKLLYYIQAWHLAFYDEPFFNGKFQAWVHGPVNREIYNRFRDTKYLYSEITKRDVINPNCSDLIDVEDRNHINNVLDTYLQFSGVQLESWTHNEPPWLFARKGYSSVHSCEVELDEDIMKKYFKSKINAEVH